MQDILHQVEPYSLCAHVQEHGSGSTPFFSANRNGQLTLSGGDKADVAHYLCMLHGRHPGVIDHAATKSIDEEVRDWFAQALDAFAIERGFLTKLTVAAGPISGVATKDDSSAAILGQRKAIEMLAQSERRGCALGTAFALAIDWWDIREILNQMALRLGIEPPQCALPDADTTAHLANIVVKTPEIRRAVNFGADQMLGQHRGLWQLMHARKRARDAQ